MLLNVPYDRQRAVDYAKRWALDRNPLFVDFTGQGGDCTSFVSQCILAGCGVMNYTPTFGWYYLSPEDRAPAWSGVDELYRFLTEVDAFATQNGGSGPYGQNAAVAQAIDLGDVIQLRNRNDDYYHSLLISGFTDDDILVCAHSDDALDRPLSTYNYAAIRVIHIEGARLFFDSDGVFNDLYNGIALPKSSI